MPSLASAPQEPAIAARNKQKNIEIIKKKITPNITGVTQDKHPSKYRRMPSLA